MDVRLPPEPVVPVVAQAQAGTSATTTSRTPLEHLYDRAGRRITPRRYLGLLTDADRELIRAATGESLGPEHDRDDDDAPLSDFAAQLVLDRRSGRLPAQREVTPGWLLAMGRTLESMGAANPYSGVPLERALRYLRSREAGGIDVVM